MDRSEADLALASQVAHLLRARGETRPIPVVGGYVVCLRSDGGVTVLWRATGLLTLPGLRMRGLCRYQRILSGLGMVTVLQTNVPVPYLACWMPGQRQRVALRVRVAAAFAGPANQARRAAS